ncbi:MAG: ankyrin repeat domain-containing protein [Candidatus Micrarchaeota archaeon]
MEDFLQSKRQLNKAIEDGDLQRVKELVEKRDAKIEARDEELFYPLHNAVMYAHLGPNKRDRLEIIEYLIDKGADTEVRDRHDWTPVYWAVMKGNIDVLKLLDSKGAHLDPPKRDQYGMSPFSHAIHKFLTGDQAEKQAFLDIAAYLAKRGALINVTDIFGINSLHSLSQNGRDDLVEMFEEIRCTHMAQMSSQRKIIPSPGDMQSRAVTPPTPRGKRSQSRRLR